MRARLCAGLLGLAACSSDPFTFDGEYGRGVPLVTGDASPLPRLAFRDNACEGDGARGGCTSAEDCGQVLLDTLSPLTFFRDDTATELSFGRECVELREAAGLAVEPPSTESLDNAIARFRFHDLPVVRAPASSERWTWSAGDQTTLVEPVGVIGGNLLRQFAIELRRPRVGPPRVALYGEFPGTDETLADDGFAFIPVQFPGRLLGRELADRCDVGGSNCELGGADIQGNPDLALTASRMVLDACVAPPPCAVSYVDNPNTPFSTDVSCESSVSEEAGGAACASASDPERGGVQASLVVATGVPGLVLFDDSARRMFGDIEGLPLCEDVDEDTRACVRAADGSLSVAGWPGAPSEGQPPLFRLAVRSLALLPGLTRTRGEGPCVRAARRQDALLGQCNQFVRAFKREENIEETTPPYAARSDSDSAMVVLGETRYSDSNVLPSTEEWLEVLVLPETHPLVLSVRRDVAPEAIQPDGLLGADALRDTATVLDYTDPNPGVRLRCPDPRSGRCMAAPDCRDDGDAACCFGLPLDLIVEYILQVDDTCCGALSVGELREIQEEGICLGVSPP